MKKLLLKNQCKRINITVVKENNQNDRHREKFIKEFQWDIRYHFFLIIQNTYELDKKYKSTLMPNEYIKLKI